MVKQGHSLNLYKKDHTYAGSYHNKSIHTNKVVSKSKTTHEQNTVNKQNPNKYWKCAGKKLVKVSQWKQCVIFCFSLSHPLYLFCMLLDHTLSLSAFSHTSVPTFLYTKTNIIFVILLLVLSLP